MRVMLGACVVGLLLLGPACRAEAQKANALRLGRSVFHEPQIAATKSLPPQFEIVWTYEAPTPGYEFSIDSVDVDASTGRIRVRITGPSCDRSPRAVRRRPSRSTGTSQPAAAQPGRPHQRTTVGSSGQPGWCGRTGPGW